MRHYIHNCLRTGGVVWNLVIFHFSDVPTSLSASQDSVAEAGVSIGSYSTSKTAGILFKFTVPVREIMVIAKVALRAGSSQQGNPLRAAVGWIEMVFPRSGCGTNDKQRKCIYRELRHSIVSGLAVVMFVGVSKIPLSRFIDITFKLYTEPHSCSLRENKWQLECGSLRSFINDETTGRVNVSLVLGRRNRDWAENKICSVECNSIRWLLDV